MKLKLSLLSAPIIMLAASTSSADSNFFDNSLTPYIGADAQFRQMKFDPNRGANVFKKNFPQGNIFAGLKFSDYVGIEVGFEGTNKRSRNSRILPSQYSVGGEPVQPNDAAHPSRFQDNISTARIHGPHVNMVGTFALLDDPRLALIGSIGVSRLKMSLRYTAHIDDEGFLGISRNFVQRKSILRLGAGIQHMITDCIGVRGVLSWENTGKFNHILPRETGVHPSVFAAVKNSFSYGFGVFVNF